MSTSSWLVGAVFGLADQSITVDANGAGASAATVSFAYEGTYLTHATAALGMMEQLEAELQSEGVTNASVFLTQSGYVRITADVSFVITWTDTALRDALGFTGTVTDTSAPFDQTAPNRSPLLWVPRRNESPAKAILGSTGDSVHDVTRVVSRDGTQVVREFGDPIRANRYTWKFINKDQYWTSGEAAGELFHFYAECLGPGTNIMLYRQVEADYTAATAATLPTPLGPYQLTGKGRALRINRSSGFEATDCRFDWSWNALKVPEYTI